MAVKKTTETVNADVSEVKYTLSNLRNYSKKLFNVGKAVFDGATAGLDINKEYTVAEVKKVIDSWLEKPAVTVKKEDK